MRDSLLWWQRGIIYQIYPRSFQDTNGDGIGDLAGIRRRLGYLRELGIEAIWLSPIYPSPMADFGYDVANYVDIDPRFGTLADFDALLMDAHGAGLKLMLDFVPNHTSDRHAWFLESRSSRDNPKRDWYMWRDPAPGGGPPNNWLSAFGGSGWEWDEHTGQYYYHSFLKEQPDLNWPNEDVQQAMFDALRFWLDRGVDGFRVDVIHFMIKDPALRDNPPNPNWQPGMNPYDTQLQRYTFDQPGVHEIIRRMRRVLDEYNERMMVGEIYLPNDRLMAYYGAGLDECHLPFNFQLIDTPWTVPAVRKAVEDYEADLPADGWPNWVLGNHDRPRLASRVGPQQARVANMLLLTLRGTPTCYYGDELGMTDVRIPPHKIQDPWELRVPGLGLGRDPERTPMQWDIGPYAGFSTVEPWLPVAENYQEVDVAAEEADPRSFLNFYRWLAQLRRASPALVGGSYATVPIAAEDVYAYLRQSGDEQVLIVLNFGSGEHSLDLSAAAAGGEILLSTEMDRLGTVDLTRLELRGNEGLLIDMGG